MAAISVARLQPTAYGARPVPVPAAPLPAQERALLEVLRLLARRAQLSAPITVNHTCALVDPASAEVYGAAMMRTLDAVVARPLAFHPRGAAEAGFDEMWLLRLIRCIESGDTDSAHLLIASRVQRSGRRLVAWLARGFAERLGEMGLDAASLEPF